MSGAWHIREDEDDINLHNMKDFYFKKSFRSPQKSNVVIELLDDENDSRPVVRAKVKEPRANKLLLEWLGQENSGHGSNDEKQVHNQVLDDQVYKPVYEDNVSTCNVNAQCMPNVSTGTSFDPFEDPFADLDNILGDYAQKDNDGRDAQINERVNIEEHINEDVRQDSEVSDDDEYDNDEDDGDESEDSDFEVSDDDKVVDVEVDMRDFRRYTDQDVEWIGVQSEPQTKLVSDPSCANSNINPNVDGIDFDEFQSGSGSDEELEKKRKKKLGELKKIHASQTHKVGKVNWYVGQEFESAKEVKDLVRFHAVETRRDLFLHKNDNKRVTVKCKGSSPCYAPEQEKCDIGGPQNENDSIVEDIDKGCLTGGNNNKGKAVITKKKKKKRVKPKVTCPFTLHISICSNESWMVKTLNINHTCLPTRTHKWCNSTFLSHHIGHTVTDNPEIPAKSLQAQLQREYSLGIKKLTVYRAKRKALLMLRGDFSQQYHILRDYILELQTTNPGTTVKLEVESGTNPHASTRVFKRIYICLGSLRRGFKVGKRDILGLDGAHMRGQFPGQVLTAVSVDANNGIYPVAYGIVEAETTSSWTWFLECLGDDLELQSNSNFTFISDRQKGIIPAIAKVFPSAGHRFCVRHIYENMKGTYKGMSYKQLIWKCATRFTVQDFDKAMEEVKALSIGCYEWLKDIPPQHWARSHFTGRAKCDILLNNICESFIQLVDGRSQPIITCLEYIKEYLMRRIVIVQKIQEKCNGPLTPTATSMMEKIKNAADKLVVTWNGGNKYQCKGLTSQCVVDMGDKECSCSPCKHVVAAIWDMSLNGMDVGVPEDWVHPAYRLQTWKEVYAFKINPCNGQNLWVKSNSSTTLLPPKYRKQVGRPKKKRRMSMDERLSQHQPATDFVAGGKLSRAGTLKNCGKCKQKGHNARGCTFRGQTGEGSGGSQSGAGSQTGANVSGSQTGGGKRNEGGSQVGSQAASQPTKSTRVPTTTST